MRPAPTTHGSQASQTFWVLATLVAFWMSDLAQAQGQAPAAAGSTYAGHDFFSRPAVTLGTPIVTDTMPNQPLRVPRSASWLDSPGPVHHEVRQFADLPPPMLDEMLPPPAYDSPGAIGASRPKPFTVDFIFMSPAEVQGTDSTVTMYEVGATYLGRIPIRDWTLLTIRPFFDVLFLSGPSGGTLQVPSELYKVAIDLQTDFRINEQWGISIGITPGLWTDFVVVDGGSFRLPARLLGTYRFNDHLFFAAGLNYTDNIRRNLLPTAGVIWDITERWRLEALYPRGRLAYKFHDEIQFYGVVEGGGDTYRIRSYGQNEDFQYRDIRLLLGTQVDLWGPASFFLELGGVVYRIFRFDIQPSAEIDPAFFLRVGARF